MLIRNQRVLPYTFTSFRSIPADYLFDFMDVTIPQCVFYYDVIILRQLTIFFSNEEDISDLHHP
jgi:hypothetical protein